MTDPKMSDLPKIKAMLEEFKSFEIAARSVEIVGPVAEQLGINISDIKDALSLEKIQDMKNQVLQMAATLDAFNDHFVSRGWIAFDHLNSQVMESAVEKAQSGAFDQAEAELVDYYNADTVRRHLMMMHAIKAFRPRMALARKALKDYEEGRYHASVPVVLALMDGLVQDLYPGGSKQSMFAAGVDLEAWDSIAGHSKGLNSLIRFFGKRRYSTRTEQLTIPYRNGIMHGLDLGYDNVMVAAKVWGALFAVADWARLAEQGKLKAPPESLPKPPVSFAAVAQQFRSLAQDIQHQQTEKDRWQNWIPRELEIGVHLPPSGAPSEYTDGTPEQKLVEFLQYWIARNYGHMAKCLSVSDTRTSSRPLAARISEHYRDRLLQSFTVLDIKDDSPPATTLTVSLVVIQGEEEKQTVKDFRMFYEKADGHFVARGNSEGKWVVYTPYVF